MILVIDNYDSFTYNLVQYIGELEKGMEIMVLRNDTITVEAVRRISPSKIIISPGPGKPEGAGNCLDMVLSLQEDIVMLGVCLGHQIIGKAYGCEIILAKQIMHGAVSKVAHNKGEIFNGIENPFPATRYHSLALNPVNFPAVLEVTATSEDGEIMGIKHRDHPVWGLQFHPESILTGAGKSIIKNFLEMKGAKH